MEPIYDIAVIGAGAVGSAIARELSRYDLKIVLLEAETDVGMGTSKASTAIWHTGYDATPGTLESTLLKRSYPQMAQFMRDVGSPFELVGGLLIAWNEEQLATLPKLLAKAHANGDHDLHILSREDIYAREPHLGPGALGGMFVPGEGILCTFTIPLACATQAVVNGVTLRLNFPVKSIQKLEAVSLISDGKATVRAQWVINAAGLYSDEINQHFGHTSFKVTPRRGELIVYDKLARPLLTHVLLPVPTATTKGVLISPTVYGNVLLGPTAEDLPDKTATNTSAQGLESLLEKGRRILPALLDEEVTATYAGLRAATEHSDYQITLHADQRYVCVGGIRSTGISGCLGIAEYVADLLREAGLGLVPKTEFKTIRMPNIGEAFPRAYQRAGLIASRPDYGQMLCHCERVSLGEVHDALCSEIPATTPDALRRRTRVLQGRCQGFNCQAAVLRALQTPAVPRSTGPAAAQSLKTQTQVLIVGAGPAGLAAALELGKLGVRDVVVAERELEAGGIPRLCGHTGFGVLDLRRVLTGPRYAQAYRQMAQRAGIEIRTGTTVTGWDTAPDRGGRRLAFTSPDGLGTIEAEAVLLATGVRERPRAARLVPGHRPQGVFTTGSLQRFVYEQGLPVGKRAVIVGAERVSLSVVMTLLHAGVKVVSLVTELPQHQLYLPVFLPAKILLADLLARAPILTRQRVTNILGRARLEGIEVTDVASGRTRHIECDTLVFTGDWIPENELAQRGGVETLQPALGPQVDAALRTSQPGVFAAGNVLRGVETADRAALEGRTAAQSVAAWLHSGHWPASRTTVRAEAPIRWICPNALTDVHPGRFRLWSMERRQGVVLEVRQAERVLHRERLARLLANTPLDLTGRWASQVDVRGTDVRILVKEQP